MENSHFLEKGECYLDGKRGADGKMGITEAAWLGPKGGLCKANVSVGENLMHVEK